MIEIKSLTKRYGDKVAVDNISLHVDKGEIVGFLGPNGAGKSTTMNIVTGYLSSTEGSVMIDGVDILDNPIEAKKKIGFLPELPPLYLDMTVREYLNFVYDLKECRLARTPHIEEICQVVRITDVYKRLIKNLSKGYRQRVGLAQALIGNPEVLIFDEPTVGLDPKQIIEMRNLIKNLGKNHTIVLSSHILPEVQAVCERIVVINKGRLVADDTADHLSDMLTGSRRLIARIAAPNADAVVRHLSGRAGFKTVQVLGVKEAGTVDLLIESEASVDIRKPLFFALAEKSWPLMSLSNQELSLEDIFMQLVGNEKGAM